MSEHPPSRYQFAQPVADLLALRSRAHDPRLIAATIAATAEAAGLTVEQMIAPGRGRQEVSHPRQVAMALCLELPGVTAEIVAKAFQRERSTICLSARAVQRRMTPSLRAAMDRIRERVALIRMTGQL